MRKKPKQPVLKLHRGKPLFSDCKTRAQFEKEYNWAEWTETCLYNDITEDIKDALEQNGHFLTPEVKEFQWIRDKIAKNISRLITTKEQFLRRKKC